MINYIDKESTSVLNDILNIHKNTNDILLRILLGKTETVESEELKGAESISHGKVDILKYRDYYDVANTITTAQATDPNDFDNANYNIERIHEHIYRNAPQLTVTNDQAIDGATIFVIVSHGGRTNFSHETPIYPQEKKTYWHVYEIRLRSPSQGAKYRVMEYKLRT